MSTLDKQYPLHYAAGRGLLPIVKHLVEKENMSVDQQAENRMNWTPLHYAAYYNQKHVVSYLLLKDARRDLVNLSGRMPIDICTNKEIRKMLQ